VDRSSPVSRATHDRLVTRFGAGVVHPWWQRIEEVVEELARRWDLRVGDPVGRRNTPLVLRCRAAGDVTALLALAP
jgi:streptomycin 6-kinase